MLYRYNCKCCECVHVHLFIFNLTVACQGVFQRKYAVIHEDRKSGTTTAKKLWTNIRNGSVSRGEYNVDVECTCCTVYKQWTLKHSSLAKQLQNEADSTFYYQIFLNKEVNVVLSGSLCKFIGTIRASAAAPQGACTGTATSTGQHPYTCIACNLLTHGKSSPLNRLILRAKTLKHPQSDTMRATRPGVNHKYCSSACLKVALDARKVMGDTKQAKIDRLQEAN